MSTNLHIKKDIDILIVEDEAILAMALESKLKKMGFNTVKIATHPDNALIYANNNPVDLAIIDINLNANKSGIDIANYLWKNFNTPIIYLTAYYNDKILNNAMEAEPYAYLIKPCRNEELKVAINTTIHKHQFFFKNKDTLNTKSEKFILIDKNLKFDTANVLLYKNDSLINLTKNEKKLFEILALNLNNVVSFNTIFNFIYREDVYDLSKLRSLIYRLKIKLGFNPFKNVYEEGYKLKARKINEHI